jgi:hypothetical protein
MKNWLRTGRQGLADLGAQGRATISKTLRLAVGHLYVYASYSFLDTA